MSASRPRVVILGGGFAGLAAAQQLGTDVRVSLVDRTRWFEFLPNIHELVSGVKTPRLLRLPRDRIVRRAGHRFVQGSVEAIDLEQRRVRVAGRRPLPYDVLVVAIGGVNATHGVPGVEEHALPFKSVDQCLRIGRRLAELAESEGTHDVVIVGGGLEGVEALGEILRRHRRGRCFRVHVVEARSRLLPEAPPTLDAAVRRIAAEHDVRFAMGNAVAEVGADSVVLESGTTLPASAVIWTGGPAAPALLTASGLAPEAGAWAPVSRQLRSTVSREVLVAGDAAELPTPLAKQGYHALDMGRCAARNVRRLLDGSPLVTYRPSEKPMLLSFGDLGGFLVAGERVLAGPALGAAKEAVFEVVMAQLDGRPWTDASSAALARLARAGSELVWPALRSPSAWLRFAQVSLL